MALDSMRGCQGACRRNHHPSEIDRRGARGPDSWGAVDHHVGRARRITNIRTNDAANQSKRVCAIRPNSHPPLPTQETDPDLPPWLRPSHHGDTEPAPRDTCGAAGDDRQSDRRSDSFVGRRLPTFRHTTPAVSALEILQTSGAFPWRNTTLLLQVTFAFLRVEPVRPTRLRYFSGE